MAEVRPDGLSAVAAFFGTTEKSHSSDTGTLASPPKHARGRVGRTLGVGASLDVAGGGARGGSDVRSEIDHNIGDEDSIVRKLHRVSGRKRSAGGRRRGGGSWGEESDEEIDGDEGDGDDDLDEDEGRTSVVRNRLSRRAVIEDAVGDDPGVPVSETSTRKRMKSKTKGKDSDKKKPKREHANSSETGPEQPGASVEEDRPLPSGDTKNVEESKAKQKPRRPKKRSRQKNIRKDKRRTMDKPEHLILGRSCYAGRVLTQETQRFLKLPPKKPRREVFGDGVRSSRALSGEEHVAGMGLAIDDLGKEGNMDTGKSDNSERKRAESKKKAKKKKSRYKNLTI